MHNTVVVEQQHMLYRDRWSMRRTLSWVWCSACNNAGRPQCIVEEAMTAITPTGPKGGERGTKQPCGQEQRSSTSPPFQAQKASSRLSIGMDTVRHQTRSGTSPLVLGIFWGQVEMLGINCRIMAI
ncbi:Hypothetical predicted protein [Pelobates cultripes]|uniref:Uncharacterized protein n=1 Tax=Pelobates cultripes TaxID=61616 RepID=A0AAD1RN64_PELCU|nr:Hypothetical predicted protein [Pelobates cultripes]